MTSKRYCLNCDRITSFVYDGNITHSRCSICGNGFGVNPNNPILKHFQEKIKNIEEKKYSWIKKINKNRKK